MFDVLSGIIASRLDDFDAFIDNDAYVRGVVKGGFAAGRKLKFTPNGFDVIRLVRLISSLSFSGDDCVTAVRKPFTSLC